MYCKWKISAPIGVHEASDVALAKKDYESFRNTDFIERQNIIVRRGLCLHLMGSVPSMIDALYHNHPCASIVGRDVGAGGVICTGSIARPGRTQVGKSLKLIGARSLRNPAFMLFNRKRNETINALQSEMLTLVRVQIFFGLEAESRRADLKYFRVGQTAIQFEKIGRKLKNRLFLTRVVATQASVDDDRDNDRDKEDGEDEDRQGAVAF